MVSGALALVEALEGCGVEHLFTTPGTVLLPLLEAASERRLRCYLTLNENSALAAADGYGRAAGTPAAVAVHTSVGLFNMAGMLRNSSHDRVPVLVLVGLKDGRILGSGAFCDTAVALELALPYAKEVRVVLRPENIYRDVRHVFEAAVAPPPGPVVLALPEDLFAATLERRRPAPPVFIRPGRPRQDCLQQAAALLAGARRPVALAGHEVDRCSAWEALLALVEEVPMPVFSEPGVAHIRAAFATDHPWYAGAFSRRSLVVGEADLLLGVGAYLFLETEYLEAGVLSEGTRVVHIYSDPSFAGRSEAIDVAIVADVRLALEDLRIALKEQGPCASTWPSRQPRQSRVPVPEEQRPRAWALQESISTRALLTAMAAYARETVLVNEGITTGFYLPDYYPFTFPKSYFGYAGGCLGWGIGAATGIKLACPERQVAALVGDGAFLFNPQALWTAARYNIPIKVVVCNNGGYASLRRRAVAGELRAALEDMAVDCATLAQALGVSALTVTNTGELEPALKMLFHSAGPMVLDVRLK